MKTVFLVIVTWPDGSEGLLFPRPGNVPLADTLAQGKADFETAKEHLQKYSVVSMRYRPGTTIRLLPFVTNCDELDEFKL